MNECQSLNFGSSCYLAKEGTRTASAQRLLSLLEDLETCL